MRKLIVHVGAILFLNPSECSGTTSGDCRVECLQALWCVSNEMLEARYCQIVVQTRQSLKWNVSEYSTTAGALEQAVQVRRPWREVFEIIAFVPFLRIWIERSCMPTRTRSKVCQASLLRAWIETLWVVT